MMSKQDSMFEELYAEIETSSNEITQTLDHTFLWKGEVDIPCFLVWKIPENARFANDFGFERWQW